MYNTQCMRMRKMKMRMKRRRKSWRKRKMNERMKSRKKGRRKSKGKVRRRRSMPPGHGARWPNLSSENLWLHHVMATLATYGAYRCTINEVYTGGIYICVCVYVLCVNNKILRHLITWRHFSYGSRYIVRGTWLKVKK